MTGSAADRTFRVTRVQGNIIARYERTLLTWICGRLPNVVTPDRLTALSVAGALLTFVSYVASRTNPGFLWVAAFGIVLNWFGDSLDGSVARYRRIERPIYGYFLDHTIDALCNLMIMAGLGFTTEMSMGASLFALVGYFLLCMYVFINNHLSGIMQLSFLWGGPTELRCMIIGLTIGMFFSGHVGLAAFGVAFTLYEALVVFAGAVMTLIFVHRVVVGIIDLRHPSRSGAAPSPQIASMNEPSASK